LIRLADQDRTLWDSGLITEGQALVRACLRRNSPGPFQIQAAIAAVHADARRAEDTDWSQIMDLYDHLLAIHPSPVVALNRAVAMGELNGVAAALEALEALEALGALDVDGFTRYQPYHAARADLLARAGRADDARDAYNRAIELSENPIERDFLEQGRAGLQSQELD
ncbi:MAG: hypothetical protein WBF71_00855, partial [Microthrixaceae bacterium]